MMRIQARVFGIHPLGWLFMAVFVGIASMGAHQHDRLVARTWHSPRFSTRQLHVSCDVDDCVPP
jgi:hypothetical protein